MSFEEVIPMLEDLGRAICLMMVLEGIMPFLAPHRWRNMAQTLATVDDRTMRMIGFVSMLSGAGILFLLR